MEVKKTTFCHDFHAIAKRKSKKKHLPCLWTQFTPTIQVLQENYVHLPIGTILTHRLLY